jgi:1-acyl-sn-glycerol-3-phosphate acyltransferase
MEVSGKHHLKSPRPALYLSNHSSQIDPLVAIAVCPFGGCGVAKKEILSVPFFGWAYRGSGHLTIDRSNRESAIQSLKELGVLVRKMQIGVWIWPEGTRSSNGQLLPFKKGFAHIALQTRLPIIPVVVKGAHELWQNKTFVVRSGTFTVEALEPISTEDWKLETIQEHITQIEEIYKQAMNQ